MSAPISYNVRDAAKAIGISQRGVWRLIRDGQLSTVKLGARTLVMAEDLDAFMHRLPRRAA